MEIFFWNSFFFFFLIYCLREGKPRATAVQSPGATSAGKPPCWVPGAPSGVGGDRAAGGRSTPGRVRAEPERASSGILREKILYQTLPLKMT